MTDPLIALSLKFIEQGGLWVLLGVLLLGLGLGVLSIRGLFKCYVEVQEMRVKEAREMNDKMVVALEATRVATDNMTRAVENNARVAEANGMNVVTLRESIEGLSRILSGRRTR